MSIDMNQYTKNNWTSSDLMDKIIQNRDRKEGWEGVDEGWRVSSLFRPLPAFSFLVFITGWNYSKLNFLIFKF